MFVAERPFSATASRRSLMDFEEARLRRRRNGSAAAAEEAQSGNGTCRV